MADRYWVGGTATWDNTAGTKWSATSGGAGGASVPFTADDVFFDAASGAVTVTTGATAYARNLNFTGFTGTFAGANALLVTGSLTLGSGMTRTFTGPINLGSALTTNTVTSNGITLANQLQFSSGGKWTLQDALNNPTGYTFLSAGTVDLNNQQWTTLNFESSNNNVRAVNFGTQGMNLVGTSQGVYIVPNLTNMTYSGTPRITLTTAASSGTRIIYNGDSGGASETKAISVRVSAGTDSINIVNSATSAINDLDFTGFTGAFLSGERVIYGNLTLGIGMTISNNTADTVFGSTSGTKTITSNGVSFDGPIVFNGAGGSWSFADNFTQNSARATTLTNGTVNGNGKNITLGSFALGSGTKTLTLGTGTWTVAASGTSWNANTNSSNLTVSPSTGTVAMTSASAKTFAGGGFTWPTLNQGGAGALTIQQANTFANITNTVQPATITFPASTTTTVNAFGVSGTSGNQITLNSSTAGTQATLSDISGINSVRFCSIQDVAATGGATWVAFTENGNVDSGNNTGWGFIRQFGRYIYTRRKNKRILP
jgi:hypothetical protein